ncbi:Na+/H+ antiporter NhaA [Algicola sagamiensis]|uniref:Na+/H+ antiporter NhaA n=1 Tax=Algicola sagamiensis TaxID=163869 RepID=UPI00035D5207|nr:Na+/H+ antiporter NhaA [Algicola sagamiensis]
MTHRFRQMIQHDATGGALLAFAALLALVFANSPINEWYSQFLNIPVVVAMGAFEINKPLLLWVNDGLMAIFFLLVGLEIKREILDGHLSSKEQIILPAIAAVAGILVPALIYVAFNYQDPIARNGWAIPSATDIAFALGVFSLFSRHVPISLKLFLLSVAIFDDIGAIMIIALFYSQDLSALSLAIAATGIAALFFLNRKNVNSLGIYLLIGLIVWASVLKSGVHATLAGFVIAWFIPLKVLDEDNKPMLPRLEHKLQPWVAFFILPLFAFANAGVSFSGLTWETLLNPVTVGIALGLFVGKQIGIFGFCWAAIKLNLATLPDGATWRQFYGVCLLCGIGFTMSLFIGTLAFEAQGLAYQSNVKLGVLIGSLGSAFLGAYLLYQPSKAILPSKIGETS